VGFYYKWFTRPAWLSRLFLRMIRPLTGIGRLPAARALPASPTTPEAPAADLGRRPTVVVGAGVAGLKATAACEGPVLLLDENPEPGGLRLAALREIAGTTPGLERFRQLKAALAELEAAVAVVRDPSVEFRGTSRVVAGYAPGGLLVRQGSSLATLQADEVVWAAGALDTLGLFPGNDTPGVMGPRALLRLLLRDGLEVGGRRVLLVGGGLDLWLGAALLDARGARVAVVVTEGGMQSEISAAIDRKWPLNTGLVLAGATGHGGEVRATFVPERGTPGPAEAQLRLDADLMVLCGRGKPAYDIPYQLGARLDLAPGDGGFVVAAPPADLALATVGEAAGRTPDELFDMTREVEA
jgi:hypothetical protein